MVLELSTAEILEIKKSDKTDLCRVKTVEGNPYKLVGCFSRGMFLTGGDILGSVSHYVVRNAESTNYLEELERGSKIYSVDVFGEVKEATVVKNEVITRPSLLIKARCEDISRNESPYYDPSIICIFLDLKESVLVGENEKPLKANAIKKGKNVLVFTGFHGKGRHFGHGVENIMLIEK